jgi:hypothetical protein
VCRYKAILTTLSEATTITEQMPRVGCACSLNPCMSGRANPHHVSSVRSLSERRPETPLRPAHLCSIVVPRCAGGPSTTVPVHQRCRERASRGQPTAVDVQPGRSVGKHRPPRSSSTTTQSPTPTTPLSWHREAPLPFLCRHIQPPMVSSPPSRASKQPPRIGGHLPDRLPPPSRRHSLAMAKPPPPSVPPSVLPGSPPLFHPLGHQPVGSRPVWLGPAKVGPKEWCSFLILF